MHLKVGLRMCTNGADLRSLGANYDMTAIAALPHLHFALLEDSSSLDVLQQSTIALLMTFLDDGYQTELGSQFVETFLFGSLCETFIHVGPFVVLAIGSMLEVLGGIADAAEFLEPQLGVLLLVVGSLEEKFGNLLITLLLGYGSKIGVFVSCL